MGGTRRGAGQRKLHPKELAYILADSGARWAFVDAAWHAAIGACATRLAELERVVELGSAEYAALRRAIAARRAGAVRADDPAWLFYTSGTTGRPKGVVITHGNLLAMSRCFLSDVEAIAPGDAILHPAPLSHGSGLYVLPHVLAGAVNVVPESGGFDPDEICRAARRWDRACFFAAPTMVKRLVAAPAIGHARLDRLKSIVYGGGPMYVADCKEAFAALGPAPRADLRPGRVADDDHRDEPRAASPTRSRAATTRGSARSASRRPASTSHRAMHDDRRCRQARSAKCSCAARR